jgi:hypothetical protein
MRGGSKRSAGSRWVMCFCAITFDFSCLLRLALLLLVKRGGVCDARPSHQHY